MPSLLALIAILQGPPAGAAGPVEQSALPPPIATLSRWADDVWLSLLDRDGSFFGRLAEEGTFQRFNPLMDHEYELDVATGLFPAGDDVRWAAARSGFRAAGASVSHPYLLNAIEWRQVVPIADRVSLTPRYLRDHSFTADRDYLSVHAEWRAASGSAWAVAGGLGVHAFKASGDLDVALVRRPLGGRGLEFELRVALLDALNNVVFDLARGDPAQTPTHFRYRALPRAARLRAAWASEPFRVELVAGSSTRSRVEVTYPVTGDSSFTQAEQVRFAGLLVEGRLGPAALALAATTARAETSRRFAAPSGRDFDLLEETSAVAARGRAPLAPTLAAELDGWVRWRPERRRGGDGTRVRHDDRELFAQALLVRRTERGWLGRTGVAYLDRQAGALAPQLDAADARWLFEGGYRFGSGFELAFGVRWDLDGAGGFDGGHLRLVAIW